jgi:hypothetical protein
LKPRTLFIVAILSLLSFVGPLVLYLETHRFFFAVAALGLEILIGAFLLVLWSWVGVSVPAFARSLFGKAKPVDRDLKGV